MTHERDARDTLFSDALTHVTLWNVYEISQNHFETRQNNITCIIPTLQLDIFINTWNIVVRSQRDACHAFQTNTMFWPFWSHLYIKENYQIVHKHCTNIAQTLYLTFFTFQYIWIWSIFTIFIIKGIYLNMFTTKNVLHKKIVVHAPQTNL